MELKYTLTDIDAATRLFWSQFGENRVFAFNGEMGAGKTTFIHHLCDYLRVEDAVSSPTFALINEYHFTGEDGAGKVIYHLDWYRLKDTAEAINAGMEDCLARAAAGRAFCFIEWPAKAPGLLKPPYVSISIESTSETGRIMQAEIVAG